MRPSEILPQHRETIRQLVQQAGMANPRIFGSVLRGEDQEDSDLDMLVDPAPRASLLAMELLQSRLHKVTGVKIDLRTPKKSTLSSVIRCLPRPPRYEQGRPDRRDFLGHILEAASASFNTRRNERERIFRRHTDAGCRDPQHRDHRGSSEQSSGGRTRASPQNTRRFHSLRFMG